MNMKVVNVRFCAVFLALSCSQPLLSATVTSASDRVTVDVPSDEDYTLSSSDVDALGTGLALYKTGAGRLIISTDLKTAGWDGEIVVSAGYLRTTLNGALGGIGKGTTVVPGATLEIEDNSASYANIHPKEKFSIGGTGVGGYGAVYATKSGKSISPNMMFGDAYVTLTANTTVGYSGSGGFRGTCGFRSATIDMAEYTLTFTNGEGHGFFGGVVKNPGRIEVGDSCSLILENEVNLGNCPENTLYLGEGSTLILRNEGKSPWDITKPGWRIETEGDATLKMENNSECSWYGPICLGGKLAVRGTKANTLTFRGAISGPGSIVVDAHNGEYTQPVVYFDNRTGTPSSYTGSFTLLEGTMFMTGLSSIPSLPYGGFSARVATSVSMSATESDTITDDVLYGIWSCVTTNAPQPPALAVTSSEYDQKYKGNFRFMLDLGREYEFQKKIEDPITVYHGGTGSVLTVKSEMTGLPNFINYDGLLKFSGSATQNVSWVEVRGGTVEVVSGTDLNLSSNSYVCAPYPDVARLKIGGGYSHAKTGGGTRLGRNLAIGAKCGRGIMEILDGALVEESFPDSGSNEAHTFVPNGWGDDQKFNYCQAQSIGSYYQRGGVFRTVPGKENFIGNYFGCYYSLEGGLLHVRGTSRLARFAHSSVVIHQRGGMFLVEGGDFNCACAGRPVWHYISGGTFAATNLSYVAIRPDQEGHCLSQGFDALSVLTVDGEDSLCDLDISAPDRVTWQSSVKMAAQHRSRAQVNLLSGGTLRGNGIEKRIFAEYNKENNVQLEGNVAEVAFDGGIAEMGCQLTTILGKNIFRNFTAVDHVRVFGDGAVIDTAGRDWSVGAPLEAPSGNGVDEIPLPEGIINAESWEFTAAPTVEIVDPTGTGTGATAVAIFDTAAGKVTGIKIMNRGNNYTTANAFISRGGHTNSWTVAATLSENVSGGFTKKGEGTLTVDKICSYTGVTRVSGGTLKLGVDGAINSSSGVILSGGTLDVDSKTFDVPILGGSGSVTGVDRVSMSGTIVLDAVQMISGDGVSVQGVIEIPAGATVSVNGFSDVVDQSKKRRFRIFSAAGGFIGEIPAVDVELAKDGWSIILSSDRTEMFVYKPKGLRFICR